MRSKIERRCIGAEGRVKNGEAPIKLCDWRTNCSKNQLNYCSKHHARVFRFMLWRKIFFWLKNDDKNSGHSWQHVSKVTGSLCVLSGSICVVDRENLTIYRTYEAYREWAYGMVVEAEVNTSVIVAQTSEVILSDGNKYSISGWAYKLWVRSAANGDLYELPHPELMSAYRGKCRCPMCLGKKVDEN